MTHTLLVDGHAHFHRGFDVQRFLSSGCANFGSVRQQLRQISSWQGVLLLAEISADHPLAVLRAAISRQRGDWRVADDGTGWLRTVNTQQQELWLIAGRQVITAERLEVLALCTEEIVTSGLPLSETLTKVADLAAICVIPWGCGKWWGNRGRVLADLLESSKLSPTGQPRFWLGDSYGRPQLTPPSRILERGQQIGTGTLAGTDPLAIRSHETLVGHFGFMLTAVLDSSDPLQTLRSAIHSLTNTPVMVGRRTSWAGLLLDQWRFRHHRLEVPTADEAAT